MFLAGDLFTLTPTLDRPLRLGGLIKIMKAKLYHKFLYIYVLLLIGYSPQVHVKKKNTDNNTIDTVYIMLSENYNF